MGMSDEERQRFFGERISEVAHLGIPAHIVSATPDRSHADFVAQRQHEHRVAVATYREQARPIVDCMSGAARLLSDKKAMVERCRQLPYIGKPSLWPGSSVPNFSPPPEPPPSKPTWYRKMMAMVKKDEAKRGK